jgi:hypothetical protein
MRTIFPELRVAKVIDFGPVIPQTRLESWMVAKIWCHLFMLPPPHRPESDFASYGKGANGKYRVSGVH